jgi:hypothetical protein
MPGHIRWDGQTIHYQRKIVEGLSPSPGHDRHRGIFPDRLLGAINTGEFLRIGARSGNVTLQTRQSLASQVTSQIVGPEINVTFLYNPKKVRRPWGISQVIIDLILNWFLKNTQRQARGSTELLFKNLLYDVHKEKVWRS